MAPHNHRGALDYKREKKIEKVLNYYLKVQPYYYNYLE
jgi:hypothetical protein